MELKSKKQKDRIEIMNFNEKKIIRLNDSLDWIMNIYLKEINFTWVIWGMKGEVGGENRNVGDICCW